MQADEPMQNMIVGIVCSVLVVLHLLVGLMAHKLDHLDSLRLSQVPLCGRPGLYHYRVLVKTGMRPGAGQPITITYRGLICPQNGIINCMFMAYHVNSLIKCNKLYYYCGMLHQAPQLMLASVCMVWTRAVLTICKEMELFSAATWTSFRWRQMTSWGRFGKFVSGMTIQVHGKKEKCKPNKRRQVFSHARQTRPKKFSLIVTSGGVKCV